MSFTCPRCWRTSYSAEDEQWGYCGNCHDYTGAMHNGNQRYSSGGVTAGSEGEMRMQPDNEEQKAKPEMPEVQREGNCDGLLQLRRERMEPTDEPPMHTVSGDGVSADDPIAAPIPPPSLYPGRFRYYFGATGLGMALGITWTIAMTTKATQRYITPEHAYMVLYGASGFFFGLQAQMLYRWNKALKKRRAELDEYWDKHFASQTNPFKQ